MSWFSRRFSDSFRSPHDPHSDGDERPSDDDDDDDLPQSSGHGKGVKEDLSQLTKSFTRQLWGVASFLAPPPQTKHDHVDQQGPFDLAGPSDIVSGSDPQIQPDSLADPVQTGGVLSSDEVVEGECQVSKEEPPQRHGDAMPDPTKAHRNSEQRLNGIGKDLAELKGSVATGISRFMKVMREEIERDQRAETSGSVLEDDDDLNEGADESESSTSGRQLSGINSLLRPLFGSILQEDKDEGEEVSDSTDRDVQQLSGPRKAIAFPRTLGDGLDGISKFASSLFPLSLESDEEDSNGGKRSQQAVGITEEVLAFARNISMHPETWLDFPLFSDDEDDDEFQMSNAQKEHVLQVELSAPRLAALRIELCPDYMSEGRFWKIYFVLLHSRLTKTDAVLLSTPQIVEARALLLRKLQSNVLPGSTNFSRENEESVNRTELLKEGIKDVSLPLSEKPPGREESFKIVSLEAATEVPPKDFIQTEDLPGASQARPQRPCQISDSAEEIQNKNILASTVKLSALRYEEEETDADKWLNEEPSPHLGSAAVLGNEEDVSFSDLEEEEEDSSTQKAVESSKSKRSYGWVQLNKNQTPEECERLGSSSKNKHEAVGNKISGTSSVLQLPGGQPLEKATKDRGESSDWLTVEEDDVASADFP